MRLNKYIANSGLCSRRAADTLIAEGKVFVNGTKVTEMGVQVGAMDKVKVDGKTISPDKKVYVLMNKPRNCICTTSDEKGRRTVIDLLPEELKTIYPVGRLDRNTTGILMLTNDGDLTQKMLHPSKGVKKVYKATVKERLTQEELNLLVTGVKLEDGFSKFDKIVELNEDHRFRYGIEIHSGKNRVIRRSFESIGNQVLKLDRVLFHNFEKRGIKQGEWRYLRDNELQSVGVQPSRKKR
jgi:23S rRNA pseudouridine2605 synthase